MNKTRKWIVAVLAVAFMAGLVACQTPAGRSPGGVVDDATITTEVKTKIFSHENLSGFGISVDTFHGDVTLTGGVNTPDDKQMATDVARSVRGVRHVNNLLLVKPLQR